jgi:hypothetical protein
LGSTQSLSCGRFFIQLRGTLRSIASINREPRSGTGRYRCRGCGGRGDQAPLKEVLRPGGHPMTTMPALCTRCRNVVEQLRKDGKITAVFICNLGRKTRYFAASSDSALV